MISKMGRKGTGKDPCQKEACAIQTCLQANNYQEHKCEAFIEALRECCAKIGPGESVVCSGMNPKKTSSSNVKS